MFELVCNYAPAGDQPQAFEALTAGILSFALLLAEMAVGAWLKVDPP